MSLSEGIVTLPDGRRLRTVSGGTAGPMVVFEAGLGCTAGSWVTVQRLVSAHARTVSYDRAGYGGSDPDPANRDVTRSAEDLSHLLDLVAGDEPVILVGHSWGGPIVRSVAAQRPERIRAVVLVDASRSELFTPQAVRSIRIAQTVLTALGRLRITPLLARLQPRHTTADGVSPVDRGIMTRDTVTPQAQRTALREVQQIHASIPGIREHEAAGLPDRPVLILVGGHKRENGSRPGMIALSRAEAERHPQGRFVEVEGAGHMVHQQRPSPTAAAIIELLTHQSAGRANP